MQKSEWANTISGSPFRGFTQLIRGMSPLGVVRIFIVCALICAGLLYMTSLFDWYGSLSGCIRTAYENRWVSIPIPSILIISELRDSLHILKSLLACSAVVQ